MSLCEIIFGLTLDSAAMWFWGDREWLERQQMLSKEPKPRVVAHLKSRRGVRWGQDPYSRGSYSFVPVGSSIEAALRLALPEWGGVLVVFLCLLS